MRPTPDRLKGLAATRWILDASTILRNDLTPYARWSSGGSVLTSDLNVPGGQFTLGGGQADSYAALFSPFKFGNSADDGASGQLFEFVERGEKFVR